MNKFKYVSLHCAAVIFLLFGFGGCASPDSNMSVDMSASLADTRSNASIVVVQDSRDPGVDSHREAAFGVSMGNVSFNPSEVEIVKATVQKTLADLIAVGKIKTPKNVTCDLTRFGVFTKTTATYWDVNGVVAFRLNVDGKQLNVEGKGTDRTYVWPGEEIFRKVANIALADTATQISSKL
jgi:hypothetical protein